MHEGVVETVGEEDLNEDDQAQMNELNDVLTKILPCGFVETFAPRTQLYVSGSVLHRLGLRNVIGGLQGGVPPKTYYAEH